MKMSTGGSGGVTVLATVPPLSKHEREFLRAHILKQREQKAQECSNEDVSQQSAVHFSEDRRQGITTSPSCEDEIKSRADRIREQGQQLQDVKIQISSLQSKLESLKEEKHRLFRQLKTVLNEEDEKKKMKDEDKKQSESSVAGDGGVQRVGGIKRPPQSPGPGMPSSKQQQQQQLRGPLLPTPEPSQFTRQNPYFWPGTGSEQQTGSSAGSVAGGRPTHTARPHHFTSARPGPNEQRFGMAPPHHHDVVVPAASHSVAESHVASHPIPFSHPVPPAQTSGVTYQQYNLTPPYGPVSSPGSTQTGPGPGAPFSQVGGQGFQLPMQHHPHSYQPLGEPAQMPVPQDLPAIYPPQDVTYMAQGGLLTSGQGMADYSHPYTQMHDPRQHRLVSDSHGPCAIAVHPQVSRESRLKK